MKSIVLLRHGESVWNKENRFTGWTDVDLTEKGVAEAYRAGNLLKEKGYVFNKAYTSYLKRAVKTLNCVLDRMDQDWIPVEKSWRLNEKHYGSLQGLNKSETAQKYGDEMGNYIYFNQGFTDRLSAGGNSVFPIYHGILRSSDCLSQTAKDHRP